MEHLEAAVETTPRTSHRPIGPLLDEIRRLPLDQMSVARVAPVVNRIVREEPEVPAVDVAFFGSAI
jgi:hypothetical protein